MVDFPLNGATAPPKRVDATIPAPYGYGLFSVARMLDVVDSHENEGVHARPWPCEPATGYVRNCDDDPAPSKSLDPNVPGDTYASPYILYGHYDCGPFGVGDLDEAAGFARQDLLLGEERGAEAELWSGALGSITTLSGGINGDAGTVEDLTPGGGATTIVAGFAALENWLGANYGGVGMLHMARGLAASAGAAQLIDFFAGSKLTTILGTRVAAGSGYDGTGPAGDVPADGETWIFASGDVVLRRSEIFDSPPGSQRAAIVNKEFNDFTALAERIYSNWIDGCAIAAIRVLIDTTCGCA